MDENQAIEPARDDRDYERRLEALSLAVKTHSAGQYPATVPDTVIQSAEKYYDFLKGT